MRNVVVVACMAGGLVAGGGTAPVVAQEPPRAARAEQAPVTRCGWSWRSLGIEALRCSACEMEFDDGELVDARFGAEPEVTRVDDSVAGGGPVRAGDRIVAIDEALITTERGVENLKRIREGRPVTLTVRRNGQARSFRIVPGDACEGRRGPLPPAGIPPMKGAPDARPPAPPAEVAPGREGRPPAPGAPTAEMPPAAEIPALPPVPPSELPPAGRLGFGFTCSDCGIRGGSWHFSSPPVVTGVERAGPAWDAGIRVGDEIVALDGASIVDEEGAGRFSSIEPGDRVRWSVRRDGATHTFVMTAEAPAAAPSRPARSIALGRSLGGRLGGLDITDDLRYQGRVGGTDVEVRGAPVTVTVDEETGEIVIRTSDTVVRLKEVGGGG